MKNLRSISAKLVKSVMLLIGLVYCGCSENMGIVTPEEGYNNYVIKKTVPQQHMLTAPEPQIKFSLEKNNGTYSLCSKTETINGLTGGEVEIDIEYTLSLWTQNRDSGLT